MKRLLSNMSALSCTVTLAFTAVAAQNGVTAPFAVPTADAAYADVADLVTISPVILDAQIRKVTRLPESQTVGVPANIQRVLIEADVLSLIRGDEGFAARARFLLDVPKDAKGKILKLQKRRFFLMGSKAQGVPGSLRLSRPDALVEWSAENDATVRAITKEAVQLGAPQAITGITSAFFTAGTVIGESETQIFLKTSTGEPISISVLSRPGQAKRWAVSTGDVIDESARAPARNSLLWYRLACSLPRSLDAKLVESSEPASVAGAQGDYRFVMESLGACGRTRALPRR